MLTTENTAGLVACRVSFEGKEMPQIKITCDTVCGGERVKAGEIIDASDADARFLKAAGKAEDASQAVHEETDGDAYEAMDKEALKAELKARDIAFHQRTGAPKMRDLLRADDVVDQ